MTRLHQAGLFGVFLDQFNDYLRTLRMPLFFLLSGMLFAHGGHAGSILPSWVFLRDKAARLLVPCLAVTLLVFVIKLGVSPSFARLSLGQKAHQFAESFIYPWQNPVIFLWFLSTLFLVFLLAPLLQWLRDRASTLGKVGITGALGVASVCFQNGSSEASAILNWPGAVHFLFYFWLGMLALSSATRADESAPRWLMTLLGVVGMMAGGMLHEIVSSAPHWMLVLSLLTTASALALAIGTQERLVWLFRPIERNSYQIFLLSWFFLEMVTRVALRMPRWAPLDAIMIASVLCGVAGPIVCAKVARGLGWNWLNISLGMKQRLPAATVVEVTQPALLHLVTPQPAVQRLRIAIATLDEPIEIPAARLPERKAA